MFWRSAFWPFDGAFKDSDDNGFLLTAEQSAFCSINPVLSEPNCQSEPSLTSHDGSAVPEVNANCSYTPALINTNGSSNANAKVSSNANPARADSGSFSVSLFCFFPSVFNLYLFTLLLFLYLMFCSKFSSLIGWPH